MQRTLVATALLALAVSAGCRAPSSVGDAAFCQQTGHLRSEIENVEPTNIALTPLALEDLVQVAPPEIAADVATMAQAFTDAEARWEQQGHDLEAPSWNEFKMRYLSPIITSNADVQRANDALWSYVTSHCASEGTIRS